MNNMIRRGLRGAVFAVLLAVAVRPATAHVDYVTDGSGGDVSPAELAASVFGEPVNVALLVGGGVGLAAAVVAYLAFAPRVPDIEVMWRTLASYQPYLPWMLRLSVGLPLVGAGFAGYFFTPNVGVEARVLQVGLGFLLLFGLASRGAAVVGVAAYVGGLAVYGADMLLASEYIAGFLGILVLGSGQPSADGLLRRLAVTDGTLFSRVRPYHNLGQRAIQRVGLTKGFAPLFLRAAVGFNFVWLGVTQKWLQPGASLTVVAKYDLTSVVPVSPEMWVFAAGLGEVAVGCLLLAGLFTRGAAVAAFVLFTATLFGLPDDPVLAHVTLFGLSSAIMVTGAGPYSLDATVVPAVRERLRRAVEGAGETAEVAAADR
ncbi:DoxX family protein [Halorientalis litorea]|uniref:DoxX family protein n=1 Tax=Halorientalis litorea TaxID=2931977 RepID=UPI003566DFE5